MMCEMEKKVRIRRDVDIHPTNPSPELRTVLAWIEATNTWPWDVSAFAAQISDDEYHHTVLPASLGAQEIKSKEEWVAGFEKGFLPLFDSFELKVHEIIEAPEGRVIAHLSSSGKTKLDIDFANEYIIICTVRKDSSGEYKIVKETEFMDSKTMTSFFAAVQAASATA
ncbi:hypothetical protein EXIGLDRAFT_746144 [Exidia glandulosa HHB12029]|uniref:SnoaL-like domain-containing protein n=1 Tax=Exidia glandulosa HHB12029 TaxID=1314781 RepID=A0A165MJ94_EXIGL|nr:hypothetical protein EXIGLDRAFT_746144 [Exidia glandulosa HHB12029]